MGVKLASGITGLEANVDLVKETSELDVSRGFDKLNSSESPGGDKAGAAAGPRAVGYYDGFNVAHDGIGFRRAPEAKVVD